MGMTMAPDQVLVLLIVLAALGFTGRRIWRSVAASRAKPGCGDDCGCGH
jgi:hypothetical protein